MSESAENLLEFLTDECLRAFGVDAVEITIQPCAGINEGFDILLDPSQSSETVAKLTSYLTKSFNLTEREWGTYLDDENNKVDGVGIKVSSSYLVSRYLNS